MKRQITSKDVAKAAGVSQSLVSFIINNTPNIKIKSETRKRVQDIAQQLGYIANVHAKSMRSQKASAIGLLSTWGEGSFVFPPVISGVKTFCVRKDLGFVICSGGKTAQGNFDFIDSYFQNRIDGLLYVSYVGVERTGVIEKLEEFGIPYVCIIGAKDLSDVSCVDVNFYESGYLAVKHLAEKGYKHIAFASYIEEKKLNYADKERFTGCSIAAIDFKIQIFYVPFFIGANTEQQYLSACERLFNADISDAVVSTSYTCFAVLKAAAKCKISIPKAYGVISFDNEQYAPYLFPSLTTIDEPLFEIAEKAASLLYDNINEEATCQKIELLPKITIRESTAR